MSARTAARTFSSRLCLAVSAVSALLGCSDDDDGGGAPGTVVVVAYGEDFVESGVAADDMDDGWAIDFERFELWARDITLDRSRSSEPGPVDLTEPSGGAGHELVSLEVPPGVYTAPAFTLSRLEVRGRATREGVTKTFAWSFESPIRYTRCETTLTVPSGGAVTFQITVHADHLFYDSLVSEEPRLLFGPLALADADDDGTLTRAELEASDIGALDPGNADIDELWSWLSAQASTLGHVDGEGHCVSAPE